MKRMLSLTLGLLLLAATNVLAQETTSSSQDIGNVPSSLTAESAVKTYTVSRITSYNVCYTKLLRCMRMTEAQSESYFLTTD